MHGNKQKRFVYKSLADSNKNVEQNNFQKSGDKANFPDDLNILLSQPASKKFKLNNGSKKISEAVGCKENMLDEFEDGFDFCEAANEINRIEVAATQQVLQSRVNKTTKEQVKELQKNNSSSILDQILDDNFDCEITKEPCSVPLVNRNTLTLKLPKKSTNSFNSFCKDELLGESSINSNIKKPNIQRFEEKIINVNESPKISPNRPPGNIASVQQSFEKKQLLDTLCQLNDLKVKLSESERKYHSKDGEIKILRESIRKMSEQEYKLKEAVHKLENELKTQQSEKEKNLILEVEKLQTQLGFIQKDIENVQEQNKKLIIEAQKKKSAITPKRSVKNNFNADGFKESPTKIQRFSSTLPLVSQEIYHKVQSKTLRNIFENSLKCFPKSTSYWNKLNKIQTTSKDPFFCNHSNSDGNENKLETYNILQSCLFMLESSDIYLDNFLMKISDYVEKLRTMVITPEFHLKENIKSDSEKKTEKQALCSHCKKVYQDGLDSLFVLGEGCLTCKSLSSCFLERFPCDNKRPHRKFAFGEINFFHKYENDDQCLVLVESMDECTIASQQHNLPSKIQSTALKIWGNLQEINQLDQENFADLFELIILFYTKLTAFHHNCDILVEYLIKDQIIVKFLQKTTLIKCSSVLHLFQNCLTCKEIYNLICTKSDKCPLLLISHSIVREMKCASSYEVFNEFVQFLSSLISLNQTKALDTLLDIDYHCAIEVVENVVIFLANDLKILQWEAFTTSDVELSKTVKDRLLAFRQGLSLLCILCTNDKKVIDKQSNVEWTYVYLLGGAISLFRRMPTVSENEVHALEDLLEMEQYMDTSEENHIEQEINPVRDDHS